MLGRKASALRLLAGVVTGWPVNISLNSSIRFCCSGDRSGCRGLKKFERPQTKPPPEAPGGTNGLSLKSGPLKLRNICSVGVSFVPEEFKTFGEVKSPSLPACAPSAHGLADLSLLRSEVSKYRSM